MNEKLLPAPVPKNPKFTPGPWRIGKACGAVVADSREGIHIKGAYEKESCKYYGGYLVGESISPGNAALIAIAPEMYSYLNMLKQYAPDGAQEEIEKLLTRAHI